MTMPYTLYNSSKWMLPGAVSVAMLLGASVANAAKPGPVAKANCNYFLTSPNVSCTDELSDLCKAIESAKSLKDRDRDGMIGKTIGADIKLEQYKTSDADAKLVNIEEKLDSLANAPKPKIDEDDANAISEALTPAQTCVDKL